jgi:saccharopine dehydrogenase-like NADP-dependent oxidoreductase
VSLLPAAFHHLLVPPCLEEAKHLVTASYATDVMKDAHEGAKKAGVLFLNEIGLDPGIDHMSCMQLINNIALKNGEVKSFESFCGGVVAPESDTNPWGYKFSWNPRNVVNAGRGVSKFIQRGQLKYIPYHKLFSRTEHISLPGIGEFDGYANRDSLKYRELYQLQHIPTFFRGTLRKRGFCKAWDIFVQLGLTDDSYVIEGSEHMTYRQFVNSSMVYRKHDSVELKLCYHLGVSVESQEIYMLKWLGVFEERKIGLVNATPADILLSLLERKWKMRPEDKDMVVMHNIIRYNDVDGLSRELKSTMKVIGDNSVRTGMAKTVGLPLAIATRLILNGSISLTGSHIPTIKEIYDPVLAELAENGIEFVVSDNLMIGDLTE